MELMMAVFMIVPADHTQPGALAAALQAAAVGELKLDYMTLPVSGFLVSFSGTTQELSEKLGVSNGSVGGAIITHVGSYWGWAPSNVWEWLSSRWNG